MNLNMTLAFLLLELAFAFVVQCFVYCLKKFSGVCGQTADEENVNIKN